MWIYWYGQMTWHKSNGTGFYPYRPVLHYVIVLLPFFPVWCLSIHVTSLLFCFEWYFPHEATLTQHCCLTNFSVLFTMLTLTMLTPGGWRGQLGPGLHTFPQNPTMLTFYLTSFIFMHFIHEMSLFVHLFVSLWMYSQQACLDLSIQMCSFTPKSYYECVCVWWYLCPNWLQTPNNPGTWVWTGVQTWVQTILLTPV